MRIELGIDSVGENWLEVDERWTRRETKQMDAASVEEIFTVWFPKKVLGLCLTKADGVQITRVEDLTLDALDDFDQRVYGFLMRALYKAVSDLFLSGTKSVRLSSRGSVTLKDRQEN